MNRMLRTLVAVMAAVLGILGSAAAQSAPAEDRPMNVILILADDLGWGEVGAYGQTKIKTPSLDAMAKDGVRFTDYHSPAPVCAPSRCMLLTGRHAGHAAIRDNREVGPEGQEPLPPNTMTIARLLQAEGMRTGLIGKWGLGGPGSGSEPRDAGFDEFYGFLCQRAAHNHFPTALWRGSVRELQKGNKAGMKTGESFAEDRFIEEATRFIRKHNRRPFFLVFAPTLPHVALQTTAADLLPYKDAFPETPYDGKKGYLADDTPRATYAAMISRLDKDVGRLLDCVKECGIDENTCVIFTSDNGTTHDAGGVDSAFFSSTGPFGGRKGGLREGGIRVPFIARAPQRIPAGRVVEAPAVGYDLFATIAELAHVTPPDSDGVSLAPLMFGKANALSREMIYWESPGYGAAQAVRFGKWKAVRENMAKNSYQWRLFDLSADPGETKDLAETEVETLKKMIAFSEKAHVRSTTFPMPILDQPVGK